MRNDIELPNLETLRWRALHKEMVADAKLRCAIQGHDFRDIGLPSGKCCVCCGARQEETAGDSITERVRNAARESASAMANPSLKYDLLRAMEQACRMRFVPEPAAVNFSLLKPFPSNRQLKRRANQARRKRRKR